MISAAAGGNRRRPTSLARPHGGLAAEGVGPESVDEAAFERVGGDDAERRARVEGAGHRTDRDAVACGIDPDLGQQVQERAIRSGGGADAEPLDGADVAATRRQIRAHDQQPRRSLRQRDDELHAFPLGKGEQCRVSAAGHEIHAAIPQRVHRVERRQQLDVRVEALLAEDAKLLRGKRRKIGVRHQVGRRDPQGQMSFSPR